MADNHRRPSGDLTHRCAWTARNKRAGGNNSQASIIALAHRGIPRRLDLTGFVDAKLVSFVIDENEGIADASDRAVHVVEHRGLEAPTAGIIVGPLALERRAIYRLRVDEFRTLYGVVGAH